MDLRNAFHKTTIALSLFGSATLGTACFGHSSSKVKDDQLGRLSAADREQLIDRERDVNVAKSNVDASKVALEEAKKFRSDAHAEAKSAKQEYKVSAEDLERAEKQGGGESIQTLAQREQARAGLAGAMNSKAAYSDQLVDLRNAQVDKSEAQRDLMDARLSSAQYELLKQNNLSENLEASKFIERERKAQAEYSKADQDVQEKLASARVSRDAWNAKSTDARSGVAEPPGTLEGGQQSPQLIEAPQPPDSSLKLPTGDSGSSSAKSNPPKGGSSQKAAGTQKPKKSAAKSTQGQCAACPAQQPSSTGPAAPAPTTSPTTPATPTPAAPATPQQPAPMQPTPTPVQP